MYKIKLVNGGIIASRLQPSNVLGENTIYFCLCYQDASTVVTKLNVEEVFFIVITLYKVVNIRSKTKWNGKYGSKNCSRLEDRNGFFKLRIKVMLHDFVLAMTRASTKELVNAIQTAKVNYEALLDREKVQLAMINCQEKYSNKITELISQIASDVFWIEAVKLMKVFHRQ